MLGLGISISEAPMRARSPFADHLLALDFKNVRYRREAAFVRRVQELPTYSFSRSGAKLELSAASGLESFAADVPGIVPNVGFWARSSLTNLVASPNPVTGALDPAGGTAAGSFQSASGDQSVSVVTGTTHTMSRFVKRDGTDWVRFVVFQPAAPTNQARMWMNVATGALGSSGVAGSGFSLVGAPKGIGIGNGWYRIELTFQSANATALSVGSRSCSSDGDTSNIGVHLAWQLQCLANGRAGPVITASDNMLGADDLRIGLPLADEDFVFWTTANFSAAANAATALASLSNGSSSSLISLHRSASGGLGGGVSSGGAAQDAGGSLGVTVTSGRTVLLLRRRAGKFTLACKAPTGTVKIGSEGAASIMPAVSIVHPGSEAGASPARDPIEFVGIRRGAFTDAQIAEILHAA